MKTVLLAVALMLSLSFRSAPSVGVTDLSKSLENFPTGAITTLESLGFTIAIGDTSTEAIMVIMEVVTGKKVNAEALIIGYRPDNQLYVGITLQPEVSPTYDRWYKEASGGKYAYVGRYKAEDGVIDFYKVGKTYIGFTMDSQEVSRIGVHSQASFMSIYGSGG